MCYVCDNCGKAIKKPSPCKAKRNKHNFCSRRCSDLYRQKNKDELRERIVELYKAGASYREINDILGISSADYHLRKMNLFRTKTEALINSIPKRYRDVEISTELLEILEGNLLGDGCLTKTRSGRSAFYQHATSKKEHLEWLSALLEKHGLKMSRIYHREGCKQVIKGPNGRTNLAEFKESFSVRSTAVPSLRLLYDKWYGEEGKHLPADFQLTPAKILHWYIGDGGLIKFNNGRRPRIRFSTMGFSLLDNERLAEYLNEYGLGANIYKATSGTGYQLELNSYSTQSFFDLIGPCPEELKDCYGYKWDY